MSGQVEEFIGEAMQFLLHECSGARLGLLTQAEEAVDDQHSLHSDSFDQFDLLWGIPAVQASFADEKHTHPLLLKKEGNQQESPVTKFCSKLGWQAHVIHRKHHLLTGGEAGKRCFVENI